MFPRIAAAAVRNAIKSAGPLAQRLSTVARKKVGPGANVVSGLVIGGAAVPIAAVLLTQDKQSHLSSTEKDAISINLGR